MPSVYGGEKCLFPAKGKLQGGCKNEVIPPSLPGSNPARKSLTCAKRGFVYFNNLHYTLLFVPCCLPNRFGWLHNAEWKQQRTVGSDKTLQHVVIRHDQQGCLSGRLLFPPTMAGLKSQPCQRLQPVNHTEGFSLPAKRQLQKGKSGILQERYDWQDSLMTFRRNEDFFFRFWQAPERWKCILQILPPFHLVLY